MKAWLKGGLIGLIAGVIFSLSGTVSILTKFEFTYLLSVPVEYSTIMFRPLENMIQGDTYSLTPMFIEFPFITLIIGIIIGFIIALIKKKKEPKSAITGKRTQIVKQTPTIQAVPQAAAAQVPQVPTQ